MSSLRIYSALCGVIRSIWNEFVHPASLSLTDQGRRLSQSFAASRMTSIWTNRCSSTAITLPYLKILPGCYKAHSPRQFYVIILTTCNANTLPGLESWCCNPSRLTDMGFRCNLRLNIFCYLNTQFRLNKPHILRFLEDVLSILHDLLRKVIMLARWLQGANRTSTPLHNWSTHLKRLFFQLLESFLFQKTPQLLLGHRLWIV